MTLNIDSEESKAGATGDVAVDDAPDPATPPRQDDAKAIIEEVIRELGAWTPRDRAPAFKQWHRGALSLIHLNVVTVLEAEGPLPMRRLAEALDVSDASATGIVDRMERRGLVERRHATDDRRLVLVHLTDAGADIFRLAERHRARFFRHLLDGLSADELSTVLASIRILLAARRRLMDATPPCGDSAESSDSPWRPPEAADPSSPPGEID